MTIKPTLQISMKTRIIILLTIIFSNLVFYLPAQTKAIDLRFSGKEEGFLKFMHENLKYPPESFKNNVIGYSITGITITPEGAIKDIKTINSLDEFIDQDVTIALLNTKGKWLKSDSLKTDQTFYVQVIYQLLKLGTPPNTNFPLKDIYNFIEPVLITSMQLTSGQLMETSESLGVKITGFMKVGQFDEAIKNVDELIRRNPFTPGLYQLKISIDKMLKRNDLISRDIDRLQNFIPEVSLDQFNNTFAQEQAKRDSSKLAANKENNTKIEKMPEFPGGQPALMNFIVKNLHYPIWASLNNIQGTVIVQFTISKEGKVIEPKIIQGPYQSLNDEALRIISRMPDWHPGTLDGNPVNVNYTMPFRFTLDKDNLHHKK